MSHHHKKKVSRRRSKKAKEKAEKRTPTTRSKIERHFALTNSGPTLCKKPLDGKVLWTDNREKAALLVTCKDCRTGVIRLQAVWAGAPPMTELPKVTLPTEPGPCFLCKLGELDPNDHFCSGCGKLICDECDTGNAPWGGHQPEDHAGDLDDYDLDAL